MIHLGCDVVSLDELETGGGCGCYSDMVWTFQNIFVCLPSMLGCLSFYVFQHTAVKKENSFQKVQTCQSSEECVDLAWHPYSVCCDNKK